MNMMYWGPKFLVTGPAASLGTENPWSLREGDPMLLPVPFWRREAPLSPPPFPMGCGAMGDPMSGHIGVNSAGAPFQILGGGNFNHESRGYLST